MKCGECGAELVDGAKFCGECGAKVKSELVCSACAAKLPEGTKFCPECGHKIGMTTVDHNRKCEEDASVETVKDEIEVAPENPSRWGGRITMKTVAMTLNDDEVEAVDSVLWDLKRWANEDRILVRSQDEDALMSRVAAFTDRVKKRLGTDFLPEEIADMAIGFVDYGTNGNGSRGTLLTRVGVFYLSGEYPKMIDGDVAGGAIPWAVLYKFGKSAGQCWKVLTTDILSSSEVDEEVKDACRSPDPELIIRAFFNSKEDVTGLTNEAIAECFVDIKKALDGSLETEGEDGEEEDDE